MMEGYRSVINRVLEDVGLPLVICFVMQLLIVKLFCSPMSCLELLWEGKCRKLVVVEKKQTKQRIENTIRPIPMRERWC